MELSTSSVSVVMLLLSAFVHYGSPEKPERTVPRVVPSKLQLLEYNDLTVNCEGFFSHSTEWKVVRKMANNTVHCNKDKESFGPCHIMVYRADTGEYWCESKDQQWRSERVFINVTVGDVVLESPVRPVMVGDNVTLRCIEKKTKTPRSTEFFFYKDGKQVKTTLTAEMTIHNISESHKGKYKCSTSDKEFSAENLLKVKAVLLQSPDRPVMEGTNVTLFCRDKMAAPNHTSVFYKDGEIIGNSSSGQMTITVSKSDEGVYKCRSSRRESEEQWLAVRASSVTRQNTSGGSQPTVSPFIGLIVLPLVLFLLWFIHKKYKGHRARAGSETCAVATKPKTSAQPDSGAIYSVIEDVGEMPHASNGPVSSRVRREDMYSTVDNPKKNTNCGVGPNGDVYSTVDKKKKKRGAADVGELYSKGKSCGVGPNGDVYSTVDKKKKKRGEADVGELYSVVKKNKGKKSESSGKAEEDSLYSMAH